MLKVNEVSKSYKDKKVLKGISFSVKEGEILGLLGPNGAGKSTLINCICGLAKIDGGAVEVFGLDNSKNAKVIRQQMGVVPQDIAVVEELSAYENCMFMGGLYSLKGNELKTKVKEALEFVGLWDRRKDIPGKYSGGMKRRLNIACALVHRPKLLIMDEPTVGVDPQSRNYIMESIRKLNDEGTTIIYTSHYMEEVEELCDRIVIVDEGTKIAEGTCEELVKEVSENEMIKIGISKGMPDAAKLEKLKNTKRVIEVVENEEGFVVKSAKGEDNLRDIIQFMNDEQIVFNTINVIRPSLEHVFLEKTGKSLRD
ncbi:ABC transporter ATP-binding protein [Bacteroides acidifaciens]|uniref:ABC transporter ATP-binding protein n=1 Tax=Bacteroides acidifaciens TaxID=85831 RepID=UPI0025885F8B|nr:ABC transporter ATP-binding protein [Bacteroides acidifaciens]